MPTPLDRYIMDSPLPMPMLLAVPTMLELSLEPPMLPLPILDMLVLAMLVSEILDMLLPLSPMVIPDLTTTDMASVKLKLILMLTQLDRLHGLPVANAIATGHAHNVGVVTGTTYAAPAYTGYAGVGYAGVRNLGYAASPVTYGYSGLNHYG